MFQRQDRNFATAALSTLLLTACDPQESTPRQEAYGDVTARAKAVSLTVGVLSREFGTFAASGADGVPTSYSNRAAAGIGDADEYNVKLERLAELHATLGEQINALKDSYGEYEKERTAEIESREEGR